MVDKIMAVRRSRCSTPTCRIDPPTLLALTRQLAFVMGMAD